MTMQLRDRTLNGNIEIVGLIPEAAR